MARPEAIFLSGPAPEVALVTGQARALPLQDEAGEPTFCLGADAWDNPTLLNNEEAALDGSFFSGRFSPDTDEPSPRAFVDAYQVPYGATPTGDDAVSYDAVRLFLEAAERASNLDADAVRRQRSAIEQHAAATRIPLGRSPAPD